MRSQDRFRGCLVGGAAGDALGYAVEFIRENEIFRRYGKSGITEYRLSNGRALISDDTQMTLFTAAGLLACSARRHSQGFVGGYTECINRAYLDWLKTQERPFPLAGNGGSGLLNVPELFSTRAPGNTCLAALRAGGGGTPDAPVNNSKGCGGVMRVAPIGLYFNDRDADIIEICRIGAEAAALTHGHPLGWMPAAMLAQIVHEISQDGAEPRDAALHSIDTISGIYPGSSNREYLTSLIGKAVSLASESISDLDAIHQLGEGWVAEEALAIAVYCAVRYSGDMDRALIASVNHNGDSDSTGAIAGNIVGAQVGLSGIPSKYTDDLELRDLIIEVADDLWADLDVSEPGAGHDPEWERKYSARE